MEISSQRDKSPRRYSEEEHILLSEEGKPESFGEAMKDIHSRKWLSALHENHIYELMELPKGKRAL